MASPLVVLDELLYVIGVLEDVQSTDPRESELLSANASIADLEIDGKMKERKMVTGKKLTTKKDNFSKGRNEENGYIHHIP